MKENNPEDKLAIENSYSEPDVKSYIFCQMWGTGKRYQSLWEGEIGKNWYLYSVVISCVKKTDVIKENNIENGAEVI